jgi:autotransporter-associated beta strand protein
MGYNASSTTAYAIATLIPTSVPITTGTTAQSSGLGSTVLPQFQGGTLQVSASGNITQNFTINNANGTIDQNAFNSNFSGVVSDAVSGTAGKLFITNSGTAGVGKVALSGVNTYSGGTEVQAGATLSIADSRAIGSGGLDLLGSATAPAILETTATMTISAPITVSGDPVFSVAPTTTLTVSSPVTDGVSAGDVVVDGGGTLNLIATNTYTGPTTINSGPTLALTGNNASIATSSAVTNNGTFDLRAANPGGVTVKAYTQGSTGILRLAATAPGTFQKLMVLGNATLNGTLDLTATAGNYAMGRYVLVDASGSRSGTFGTFNTNLASVTPSASA